jgi:hypothetical protein
MSKGKKKPCPDLTCGRCSDCLRLSSGSDGFHGEGDTPEVCGDCDASPCRCGAVKNLPGRHDHPLDFDE